MSDTVLSITGTDVVNVIRDMQRRKEQADKISQVYFRLASALNGQMDKESQEVAEKILAGVTVEERNLAREVKEWVLSSNGIFLSSDVIRSLQVSSRIEKQNISNILGRMRDDKIIRKVGDKNGCFRKVDNTMEEIDFINVSSEEIAFRLPLDIHHLVKLLPKNIVVVAGEPNAGKTAFLLNCARENQEKFDIHYYSSEMGPKELQERLIKFPNYPLSAWKTHFWERASDFGDAISRNSISLKKGEYEGKTQVHIIDFLEVYKDFWEVSALIKDIWDRIDNSIAIIALQKNRTKKSKDGTLTGEYGLGGERGLEKARLYITMSGGNVLKIVKAKNWRTDQNPNGLQTRFKLRNGCLFSEQGGWTRESEKFGDLVKERARHREPGDDPV